MTVKEIVEMLLDGDVKATDSLFIRVFNEEGNFFELKAVDSIGTMTNNGTITLNSASNAYSSLIINGTATGDVNYNRTVNAYTDNDNSDDDNSDDDNNT
mgnify:CR=1 FL=1